MKVPQVIRRRIGDVCIFDFRGELTGEWAMKEREEIAAMMKSNPPAKMLINLKGLDDIDTLGVKAIVENMPHRFRGGFMQGSHSVMRMFDRAAKLEDIKLFRNEEEVIGYFGKDLVECKDKTERRRFARLKTALPVEFYYENQFGTKVYFRAIVTDLSEGGLFIEYLDLEEASAGAHDLNPYDFRLLKFKIKMPDDPPLEAWGKVIRIVNDKDQIGMGIEFYEIEDNGRKRIAEFLE
ncbi:MAG: PilZ domain-containing protein [Candidatus Omnitrophica bacterium]|nr:PilZ domain-containing protein [Candidatus Omnitrophota bacterium]